MLIRLAVWYLRKRKISVLMNFHLTGGTAQQLTHYGATYNTRLDDVDFRAVDGKVFNIPEGHFRIVRKVMK